MTTYVINNGTRASVELDGPSGPRSVAPGTTSTVELTAAGAFTAGALLGAASVTLAPGQGLGVNPPVESGSSEAPTPLAAGVTAVTLTGGGDDWLAAPPAAAGTVLILITVPTDGSMSVECPEGTVVNGSAGGLPIWSLDGVPMVMSSPADGVYNTNQNLD